MSALIDRTDTVLELVNIHGSSGQMDLGTVPVLPGDVLELMTEIEKERAENEDLRAKLGAARTAADTMYASTKRHISLSEDLTNRLLEAQAEIERLRANNDQLAAMIEAATEQHGADRQYIVQGEKEVERLRAICLNLTERFSRALQCADGWDRVEDWQSANEARAEMGLEQIE